MLKYKICKQLNTLKGGIVLKTETLVAYAFKELTRIRKISCNYGKQKQREEQVAAIQGLIEEIKEKYPNDSNRRVVCTMLDGLLSNIGTAKIDEICQTLNWWNQNEKRWNSAESN